jgi:RNA polymerase sigma factor (sigma-70 family)
MSSNLCSQRIPSADETEVNEIMNNMARAVDIFSKHGNFIRNVIDYRVKDPDLADDLYHDFFLSLLSKPIPLDVHNVESYLFRAIVNDSYDAIRRIETYEDRIQKYANYCRNPINEDHPENALIEKEEMEKLFTTIKEILPSSESKAIILKFKNNNSIEEVAKEMKVNRRTVSRYISVGLKKCRQFPFEKEDA